MPAAGIEIVCDTTEVTRSEWLKYRLSGIGGSDAGAIAGLSKWKQPYGVWAEKVAGAVPDDEDEKEAPEYQLWGHLLEQPIADEFARRAEVEVHSFTKMVRSKDYPFMYANVDFLTGPSTALEGVLEVKTTRFADDWTLNDDGSVHVPLSFVLQGQHYLAVLGLAKVHYACLIGGQELRIAEVERNESLIEDLVVIEAEFWRKVMDREPPDPDGSESTRKALQKRWQPDPGKTIELPDSHDWGAIFALRAQKKAEVGVLEEELGAIDATVMAAMGDAEVATVGGKVAATWKQSTSNRLDTKALKEAHPDIAAEFTKASTTRRFLPKEITPK